MFPDLVGNSNAVADGVPKQKLLLVQLESFSCAIASFGRSRVQRNAKVCVQHQLRAPGSARSPVGV